MIVRVYRCLVLAVFAGSLLHASTSDAGRHGLGKESQWMMTRLQQSYEPETGVWTGTGWWNSANVLTVVVDSSRVMHTDDLSSVLAQNVDFIRANARAIVAHQGIDHSIGIDWAKPATMTSVAAQTSGLDAIVAALSLEHRGRG